MIIEKTDNEGNIIGVMDTDLHKMIVVEIRTCVGCNTNRGHCQGWNSTCQCPCNSVRDTPKIIPLELTDSEGEN